MDNTALLILDGLGIGGLLVVIAKGIFDIIMLNKQRKAAKEDRQLNKTEKLEELEAEKQLEIEKRLSEEVDRRLTAIEDKTDAQSEALKYILYDRIRFLATSYIKDGEVDFDDRRILRDMHKAYHNGLNGNGDLDLLMNEVDGLDLKTK